MAARKTAPRKTSARKTAASKPKARRTARERSAVREKLDTYRAKRKFDVTAEPSGDAPVPATPGWSYVIQKHDASRLHYDFRLELDGVLLSWSVPKGPSLQPGSKRLAVRTEDHPLDYRDFEGIIPEGEYGGGTVVVWDRGTWTPEGDARDMMKRGRLTFELHGEKLRGRWHLVRTRPQGKQEGWLLFKSKDAEARSGAEIVDVRPESVISGRTVEEVAQDKDAVWHSNKQPPPAPGRDLASLVAALPTDRPFTNLDKVLWPEAGITKAQLIAYYAVASEQLLPHVRERPLTLVRAPNGHTHQSWFQKHADKGTPAAIKRVTIRESDGEEAIYLYIDDLKGLLACAQIGALELHTWGSRNDTLEKPDLLVFDLDPDPTVGWPRVAEAARELKARLETLELEAWVKTTGGKGLHVCVPIAPSLDWDETRAFCAGIATQMERDAPDRFTANMAKAKRTGKIFVDYVRNTRGATFVAPYSPRRRPGAGVATPITWDELARGIDPASFTVETVPRRLSAQRRDPWADLEKAKQKVSAAARKAVAAR